MYLGLNGGGWRRLEKRDLDYILSSIRDLELKTDEASTQITNGSLPIDHFGESWERGRP